MSDELERLEEALGVNLNGTKEVANDTKDYFVERAVEEDLTPTEMLTAIRSVKDLVEDSIDEAREIETYD